MLDLIPAIDIKGGSCVRLMQGDLDKNITVYSRDPLEMAARWADLGAKRLHLVDLDGARNGRSVNHEVITEILKAFGGKLKIDLGGGLRLMETVDAYMDAGLTYAVLGTAAVKNPEFLKEACKAHPDGIIVSLDARNGFVATDGWEQDSEIGVTELAKEFASYGPAAFLYTDISRDGMLCGVNVEATRALALATPVPVIASGGVKNMDDIREICRVCGDGIGGMILGKALYEGTLDFAEALRYVKSQGLA